MGINKNFVVRNGLEVADTLLYANDETNRVGINSGTPEFELDVIGDASIDGGLFSPVSSGGTSGVSGQYLQSTGDKWRWESFPISRQQERITLTAGQTRVPATGNFPSFLLTEPALTSVFIDGVKLTEGDYVINAGGGSITLFAAAFGGEEIEIIAHGAAGVGAGNTGILGVSVRKAGIDSGTAGRIQILDFVGLGVTLDGTSGLVTAYIDSGGLTDVVSDPSPQLGGYLDLNNRGIAGVGVITATEFHGDGSNITGISTLNITGYGVGLGGGANVAGLFGKVNNDASVGIFTDTAAVGLGTTNPRFQTEIGSVGAAGTQLWVNGDARVTGILTIGTSSITLDGRLDEIRIGTALTLSSRGDARYSGIITAPGFDGDLVGQHKIYTAGVVDSNDYTLAMFLDPTQGGHTYARYDLREKLQYNPSTNQLSVAGVTSTRGLQVTGVSTFTESVNFERNVQFGNNDQLIFGAGNDLRIYFDGTNSYIQDQGDGGLNIDANPYVSIGQYGVDREMASFRVGAGVSLFYNNSKKFETTDRGIDVTGEVDADGLDVTADKAYFRSGRSIPATLQIETGYAGVGNTIRSSGSLHLKTNGSAFFVDLDTTSAISANGTGASQYVTLFGEGSNKLRTSGEGVTITGTLDATNNVSVGGSFIGSGIGLTGIVDAADGTYGGSTVSPQITVADGRITGITATLISGGGGGGGTEVIIEDNDSLVGTAGTINFGSGLSVTSASAGVVTVTAASVSTDLVNDTTPQLGGNLDLNNRTINGTGNINITGSSRFNGITSFTSDVHVYNGQVEAKRLVVWNDNDSNEAWRLFHGNSVIDSDNGNAPIGNGLFISPQETADPQDGIYFQTRDSSEVLQRTLVLKDNKVGVGTTNATSTLTVVGDVNVSGVSTFQDDVTVNGGNLTFTSQGDQLKFTTAASNPASGGCIEIQTSATSTATISGSGNQLKIYNNDNSSNSIDLRAATYSVKDENADYYALFNNGSVKLYNPATDGGILDQKFETTAAGINVTGAVNVSGISSATAESGTFTASAGVAYTANTYGRNDFVTAEYTLYFSHSSGIQSQKVLVMDDGTNAYAQEYAIMFNNDLLVSVGATVRSGNVELEWTPETGVNGTITYRYTRETMI